MERGTETEASGRVMQVEFGVEWWNCEIGTKPGGLRTGTGTGHGGDTPCGESFCEGGRP